MFCRDSFIISYALFLRVFMYRNYLSVSEKILIMVFFSGIYGRSFDEINFVIANIVEVLSIWNYKMTICTVFLWSYKDLPCERISFGWFKSVLANLLNSLMLCYSDMFLQLHFNTVCWKLEYGFPKDSTGTSCWHTPYYLIPENSSESFHI